MQKDKQLILLFVIVSKCRLSVLIYIVSQSKLW